MKMMTVAMGTPASTGKAEQTFIVYKGSLLKEQWKNGQLLLKNQYL